VIDRSVDFDPTGDAAARHAARRRAAFDDEKRIVNFDEPNVCIERYRLPDDGVRTAGGRQRKLRADELDVAHVHQRFDRAGMNVVRGERRRQWIAWKRRRRRRRLRQRVGISLISESAIAGRHPPGVFAQDPAAPRAIHCDRAHHLDPPWIQDALHLDHLVRGAADKHVEARFDDRRADSFRIAPVAQQARAVAG
jgi:hypothetical protein